MTLGDFLVQHEFDKNEPLELAFYGHYDFKQNFTSNIYACDLVEDLPLLLKDDMFTKYDCSYLGCIAVDYNSPCYAHRFIIYDVDCNTNKGGENQ